MSTTGIYGLSGSGIDVDSMVKVGMMTKQNQYDKMYKEEIKNEWMKSAYADLYSEVNTFNQSTLSNYKRSSTTSPMTATSTSEGVATATANADAANMSHTVTVSSVASNAYMQSTKAITRKNSSASSTSIYLKDLLSSTEQEPSNYSTMSDSQKLETALSFTISDGASDNSNATTKEISFTYKDLFESNQTLNDLATKIKNSGVNIQASYDSVNDSFSLYQKTGGKANQINITVGSGSTDSEKRARTLLSSLNLGIVTTADDGTQTLGSAIDYETTTSSSAEGKDGKATIDGKTYTTTGSKITVANVAYTLAGKGTTTVSVAQDTDKVVENVKQFVTDYNKMIDALNTKYYEQQYSDYGVLTKSQESSMTQ
ncbi:MAG: flagellar filament capping protein FliD, partial [Veillonellaceae bacterium]|nr:flagellar filament capping protein FliD [Veillonellaceae bacterium]